jgi:hypothetical protein
MHQQGSPSRLWKEEKKRREGREGEPVDPQNFFLSQPNLTKPPLSVFSFGKIPLLRKPRKEVGRS